MATLLSTTIKALHPVHTTRPLASGAGSKLFFYWTNLSILFFALAAAMGAFLRMQFFSPVPGIHFKNFLHGHSHLAFLGWIFNALFTALLYAYLPGQAKKYRSLFGLLQVTVIGMLIMFPLQGYAAASIAFSTLHILLSYAFVYKFLNDVKHHPLARQKHALSLLLVRWSLFFMILSTAGPFALGVIKAKGLAATSLYQLAIYFYLHFQYDGWFTFAVLGLLFWILEHYGISFSQKKARYFVWLFAMACLPAYALSTLWAHPPAVIYAVAGLAVWLQLAALYYFLQIGLDIRAQVTNLFRNWQGWLMAFALGSFAVKLLLQSFTVIPALADKAYLVRNFTVGYLHLVFLGFISAFLIGWLAQQKLIVPWPLLGKVASILYLTGFVSSELCIFAQPLWIYAGWGTLPYYQQILFMFSCLMPAGIMLLLLPCSLKLFNSTTNYIENKKN